MSPIRAADPNPTHGRFLSVDPIMDLTDPAQWHAYTYANNNPTTYSDPTGLAPMIDGQWGSPQAAAKAPSSKRLPTIKDETGGYTPAGYSPRPSRDDRGTSRSPVPPVPQRDVSSPPVVRPGIQGWSPFEWLEGFFGSYEDQARDRITQRQDRWVYKPIYGQTEVAEAARAARAAIFGSTGSHAARLAGSTKSTGGMFAVAGTALTVYESYQMYDDLPTLDRWA